MDKITLKEMTDYAKDVRYYCKHEYSFSDDEKAEMDMKMCELKCILYNDWCKRFESLNLAKFALKAILADKDEWGRDDAVFLKDILEEYPMKDDAIYDLEATMLCILNHIESDVEYF